MSNPLTLEAFAEWCEKQPARKQYDYWNTEDCACAQYAKSIGDDRPFHEFVCGSPFWTRANARAFYRPWSFKSLAKRLRGSV